MKRTRKIKKINEYVYDYESGESEGEGISETPQKKARKPAKKTNATSEKDVSFIDCISNGFNNAFILQLEFENFCKAVNADFAEVDKIQIPVESE